MLTHRVCLRPLKAAEVGLSGRVRPDVLLGNSPTHHSLPSPTIQTKGPPRCPWPSLGLKTYRFDLPLTYVKASATALILRSTSSIACWS